MVHIVLTIELLLSLCHSIPPTSLADDLPDRRVVIALTDVEPVDTRSCLRFYIAVFSIENLVKFLEELLIQLMLEVWGFYHIRVQDHTVASWYRYLKIAEQLY